MAFIQMNLLSQNLMRTVPVNVILPADKQQMPGMPAREEKPYKTLYLLHGIFGNYMDWVKGTKIMRYAEEHDLAVVMPSGDNSFYVDHPEAMNNYGKFVGKELVEMTRKMFPLSRKREDTFIGGLSMGGAGALLNGLKYHETFGYIVSLSGAFLIEELPHRTNDTVNVLERRDYAESIWGNLDQVAESENNPKYLVRRIKEENAEFPEVYIACGEQDGLRDVNLDMYHFLKENGVNAVYESGAGAHEWDFWDTYIKRAMEWLPTENTGLGRNSGNVGI